MLLLFSCSVMSDSLQPHELWHARLPCPSLSPRVWSNSWASSQWCHSTISSSVVHFFSCLQSFLASGSLPMSQLFTSGGQSIGASASASVLPRNIQGWFPLGLIDLIALPLDCPKDSQESSPTPQSESITLSALSLLYGPPLTSTYDYWKNHNFDYTDFCQQSAVSAFAYTV